MWKTNKDEKFTSDDIGDNIGFVYMIKCKSNGKMYIGKKNFWSKTRKSVKGKKRKTTIIKESDWQDYYGSSADLILDVEKYGKENFIRKILHLCKSKGSMSYMEIKEQIDHRVLFNDVYYNNYIGCRIHGSHIK